MIKIEGHISNWKCELNNKLNITSEYKQVNEATTLKFFKLIAIIRS